jgi:hypothetical protein
LIQVIIGIVQAAFIDYEVLAFGFINYSALATDNALGYCRAPSGRSSTSVPAVSVCPAPRPTPRHRAVAPFFLRC